MRSARILCLVIILLVMIAAAWIYGISSNTQITLAIKTDAVKAVDGDSFIAGIEKYRLQGIDAPELKQVCKNAAAQNWRCGYEAQQSLKRLLSKNSLACKAGARDKYGRLLAACSAQNITDIAAAQVSAGYAISDEFNGIKSYGEQENAARLSKKGLWQGQFDDPKSWREMHKQQPGHTPVN
jgi:endonuclease YncB( thermonuclease family)